MTAKLLQYPIRPQLCGLGFDNGIQSFGVLSLVRRLASKGDIA